VPEVGPGPSDDVPLAVPCRWHRAMRIVDDPDALHLRTLAEHEAR